MHLTKCPLEISCILGDCSCAENGIHGIRSGKTTTLFRQLLQGRDIPLNHIEFPGIRIEGAIRLRHRTQQRTGIRMLRIREQFNDPGCFDNLARVHDGYSVRNLGYDTQIMGDQDDPGTRVVPHFAQQIQYLSLNSDIQRGRRFIRDDDRRITGNSNGNADPLTRFPGQLMRVACRLSLPDPPL